MDKLKKLWETYCNENEYKMKKLEDEVNNLKLEITKLVQMDNKASNKSQDSLNEKLSDAVNDSANIPVKIKFKCDMCDASFKKKITLQKHRNSKHNNINCFPNKKIGERQFGFAFDVIPGH